MSPRRIVSAVAFAAILSTSAFAEAFERARRLGDDEIVQEAADGRVYVIDSTDRSDVVPESPTFAAHLEGLELHELGGQGDEVVWGCDAKRLFLIPAVDEGGRPESVEIVEFNWSGSGLEYDSVSGRLLRPAVTGSAPQAVSEAEIRLLNLATNDLVYDPVSGMIYASVPGSVGVGGNSVLPIDPVLGTAGTAVFIGSEPGALAVSDDGQYVYVSLEGAFAVRRFDLFTQTAGLQFALGSDPTFGPYVAEDLEVQPENASVVAVSRKNPGFSPRHAGVAIYDEGVVRPNTTQRHTGSNRIEFSADPSLLYGYNNETSEFGFRKISVDTDGANETSVHKNFISGFNVDIEFHDGRIYATTGVTLDPGPPSVVGTYSGFSFAKAIRADAASGLVYVLTTSEIRIYDLATFALLDTVPVPGISGTPGSLVLYGPGQLAFRTSSDQVFLLDDLGADLSILKDNGQTETNPGDPISYTITVSNAGPREALGATVSDIFPPDLVSCSWTCVPSAGASCTLGPVAGDLSDTVDLPVGESVVYTVDCTVDLGASTPIENTATVSPPAGLVELHPSDNSATDTDVLVLGSCGSPDDRLLFDFTVDDVRTLQACLTITTGPNFAVVFGGEATLRAGEQVILRDGTSVELGAGLVVEIDPSLLP